MTYVVGVLGNSNIDLVMGPLSKRPQFGQELVVPNMETRATGSVGYTVAALDHLGLPSIVVGTVGDDQWGDFIRREFSRFPLVDLASIETVYGAGTGLSVALLDETGQRGFVTYTGALTDMNSERLARHEQRLLAARYVLVCGYFFMPALRGAPMQAFLQRARQSGVKTMLDTGWDLDDWPAATLDEVLDLLPSVDIFLPNIDEARALAGSDDPNECAQRLLARGAGAVALKLGAGGSLWADQSGVVVQPGRAVRALDTTGAGDSFNAALVYGLEQGWPMAHTLDFANAYGSLLVSRLQNRTPTLAEALALVSA